MKSIKIPFIVVFLLFSTVFAKAINVDSVFFKSFNLRYQNPDKGIQIAKSLLEKEKTKAFIALGYNYYFKSDYDSATFYFDSIMKKTTPDEFEYYLALTGKGLIQQRYGYYDKSYENLMKVNEFFNNEKPMQKTKKLYFEAKAINLIGLATLEYYYTNSYDKIKATLGKIEELITSNENHISNEIKCHLYYLYTENHLCNCENNSYPDLLPIYLKKYFINSDTSQYYLIGNLFELIGKYKLEESIFEFLHNDSIIINQKNEFLKTTIIRIFEYGDNTELQSLKTSLSNFSIHGDPYQLATSNLFIAKYYFNLLLSDSSINSSKRNFYYQDSLVKYMNQANSSYHIRDTIYFNNIFRHLNIDSVNINTFISKLVSLNWYIKNLKQINEYYGLTNNKQKTLFKKNGPNR